MGGGGGTSGEVILPDYIESFVGSFLYGQEGGLLDKLKMDIPDGFGLYDYLASAKSPLTVAGTNNPYRVVYTSDAETYTDPATRQTTQDDTMSGMLARVLNLDEQATLSSMLQAAAQHVDVAGRLNDIAISTLQTDSKSGADTEHSAALAVKDTGIVETSQYQSFMNAIKSIVDQAGMIGDVDFDAIADAALTQSTDVVAAALTAALGNTGIAPTTNWETHIDEVVTKLKECGVLEDIDIPQLFNQSMAEATSQIERAVESALEIVQGDLIDAVVDGYQQRIEYRRATLRSTFSARMADAEAVHSSAHLIGLALIDAQVQADVDNFDAQLTLQAFQEAQRQHGQRVAEYMQLAVQAAGVVIQQRTNIFVDSMRHMLQLLATRAQFEQALTALFGDAFGSQLNPNTQAEVSDERSRDDVMKAGLSSLTTMFQVKQEYEQRLIQLHSQLFLDILGNQLQAATIDKQHRDRTMIADLDSMVRIFMDQQKHDVQSSLNYADLKRTQIIQTREWEEGNFDLRSHAALWPIRAHMEAANVAGGPVSGLASFAPETPSKAASVASGVLGGAAAGSTIPGIGTAAGAALGGLAALL